MLYKIEDKFYIRANGYYIEVEPIFDNGDVRLKPTDNKIECSPNVKFVYADIQEIKNSFKPKKNKFKHYGNSKSIIDEEF